MISVCYKSLRLNRIYFTINLKHAGYIKCAMLILIKQEFVANSPSQVFLCHIKRRKAVERSAAHMSRVRLSTALHLMFPSELLGS